MSNLIDDARLASATASTVLGIDTLRGGDVMSAKEPDARGVEAYLRAVDVPRAIREVSAAARELSGLRGAYLDGLALALQGDV